MFGMFQRMANLSPGVLIKLLGEMGVDEVDRKPVLLQIRSIIPAMAEGDLWPNQGFYLKVSDSSHAMYVSLPHEQDDLVLCNKLRLGQLIYVEKLEMAYPVPVLNGVNPIQCRQPCVGSPKNLVVINNLANVRGVSDFVSSEEKDNDGQKKPYRSLSTSKVRDEEAVRIFRRSRTTSIESENCDEMKATRKNRSAFVEKECDSESTISSGSSAIPVKRRSWNGVEISDSPFAKRGIKPSARRRSASVSPTWSVGYDSSDDNSNSKSKRKDISIDLKSVKSSDKCRIPMSVKCHEQPFDPPGGFSWADDEKMTETKISWNSLPPALVDLGKEVLRHRDVALLAAVEALQEASAAERLLKCLSTYSEFQAAERDAKKPSVDKFLSLQDDLMNTQSIVQSLTNISPLRGKDHDPNFHGSIRESLKLAMDRKKNATIWIETALASDLTLLSAPSAPKATNLLRKSSLPNDSELNGMRRVRKQRNNGEIHIGLAAEKDGTRSWVKGSALDATVHLTNSLHDEFRKWFLAFVETYLDEINSKTISIESDSEVGEMMYQIKQVSDWLDVVVNKEVKSPNPSVDDSELETYGRVRDKIYAVLLKNAERTAMAFENMNLVAEG
ncbi:hypothetical protein RGQ29_005767 [Quercus rubra]|uniref:Uncharacterized protein n=1 Tax=Quercus rubra TaxID=3512 RepID=A0AAN7IBB0_QUERU|nr:hypothetical protein RGQ29_005767 [Quercus rubra]